MLYLIYKEAPDMANTLGLYPKADTSHGFPMPRAYEMYRDWQENSINSDGWFAMLVYFVCFVYSVHVIFTYIIPHTWIRFDTRNEVFLRFRMKGMLKISLNNNHAISSVIDPNFIKEIQRADTQPREYLSYKPSF